MDLRTFIWTLKNFLLKIKIKQDWKNEKDTKIKLEQENKAKAEKEAEKTAARLKRMRKSQAEQEFNIWLSEKLDIEIWREYEKKHNPAQDGAKSKKKIKPWKPL